MYPVNIIKSFYYLFEYLIYPLKASFLFNIIF